MLLARARLARRLRAANVPPPPAPYTVDAWCEVIGRTRGRRLQVHGVRLDAELPSGLLVRRDDADYILVDAALPALARAQTALHEVAHLVLDHDGDALHSEIDPAVEAEAELAADLLYRRLARASRSSGHGPAAGSRGRGMPVWPSTWWTDRRTDWHVNQLWMTLRAAMPDAAIVSTSTAGQVPVEVGGSRQRYRRVIEVHDALRLLRPWCCRRVYASATRRAQRYRLEPTAVAAVAEAAAVAVALRRRQAALPAADDPLALSQPHDVSDVRAEARRLTSVARALHDSPLVAVEVARWAPVVAAGDPAAATAHTIVAGVPVAPISAEATGPAGSAGAV